MLDCPSGTLAYGITIATPESVYWRDPSLGPPPFNSIPIPLSVCLLCHKISIKTNIELDDDDTNNLLPSYQVCIGKGSHFLMIFLLNIFFIKLNIYFQVICPEPFHRHLIA